ncbi:nucleolar protein 6 [Strongylocentrotus purpuratus]|uniref:Nucleolar protein 6 n=1 Tax=Strongylocentrotus purpuratus TaxID=7668 RepID=A0A7M7N979_STRPU|nr:nucleolar protein 6 [Strongylocentrotus purpuratus]
MDDEVGEGVEESSVANFGKRPPGIKNRLPSKKQKLNKAELYKPPTMTELASLKETEMLYNSSLFKLQMDELRMEVELKEKKKKGLLPILQSLEEILRKLPPMTIPDASELEGSLPKNVCLPMRWKKTQLKGEIKLRKPLEVKIIGSYLLGTCLNDPLTIDMAVQIPTECFQPKDYLNFRYHHKRALYCMYLVKHLKKKKDLVKSVSYGSLQGDHMTPVILLKLVGKNATVRLIPCLPETGFKEARFAPSKNNIRQQWYNQNSEEETFPPTPHYNFSILRDMSLERHLHHLYNASYDFPAFKDAVLLLKVWLHQRELDQICGGCNGFLISMVVAHLLDNGQVNKVMSGQQVVKNVLHFIVTTDWASKGVTMCKSSNSQTLPGLEEFHQHFPVVFVDPSGYLNLCADMTGTTYEHLKHEAKLGLDFLDDKRIDGFHCLFMTPVLFTRKFDHLFTITKLKQLRPSVKKFDLETQLMDRGGNYPRVVLPRVEEILRQALGDRIKLLASGLFHSAEWPVNSPSPKIEEQGPLTFGLLLNGGLASSVLDKGPAANTTEAKAFSEFWGKKSELRRFQDGSICEAVVWPGTSVAEKRLVCSHIVRHILHLHAGIKPESIAYTGGQLDPILQQPLLHPSSPGGDEEPAPRTGEEELLQISVAYTKLSRHLRELKDLPLMISSVQGTSPAIRHTEVYPPCAGWPSDRLRTAGPSVPVKIPSNDKQCPTWIPALRVVCHLESSGKWPDDLEAIHHIKTAFHLKMADMLHKQCKLVTVATASHILAIVDGFVFQVSVAHRREIVLLKEVITKEGLSMLRDNERSKVLERETGHLPHLTSLLHGVHQHHGAFGPTVRLAKRWVASHLLADHMTSECIELLVAYLFLHPEPFTSPVSPQTGILHFLNLLCQHDWESTPLFINFNNDLTASDYDEIRQQFTNNRSHLPVMFLATPTDRQTSLWTQDKPTPMVIKDYIFQRLIELARESFTVLQQQLSGPISAEVDFKQIFRPPLDPYDVVIHLRAKLLPRRHQAVDADPTTESLLTLKPTLDAKHLPVVDFDPVQCYLVELREAFEDLALFFHDTYGGDIITVVWKRPAFKPQPFKPLQAQARIPSTSSSKVPLVIPNIEGIIQDFQTMGRGLVTSIEVRTENWNI